MVDIPQNPVTAVFYDPVNQAFYSLANLATGGAGFTSAQLPATLGAKTGATSLSIVPATDATFLNSAQYLSTRLTYSNGQTPTLQTDTRGNLGVAIFGGNNINPAAVQAPSADNFGFQANFGLVVDALGYGYNESNFDRLRADLNGLCTQPYALTPKRWQYAAASGGIVNSTTAVTIAAAGGAGIRNYVTGLQVSWDVLGAATELVVRDGAAGTVVWRYKIQAGTAGTEVFNFAIPLKGTAVTLMEVVTLTASITGGVYVNAQGFLGI